MTKARSGSLVASLVRTLLRHKRLVLALSLLVGLVAGMRTVQTYAALRSDLEELLPTTAPSVLALSKLRERLPGIRHLGVVVAVDDPSAAAAGRRFLDALSERVRGYPKDLVAEVRADGRIEREFAEKYALQLMDSADVRKLREAVEARRDWDVSRGMGLELEDEGEAARPEIPIAELRAKYEARYGKPRVGADDRFVSPDGKNLALLIRTASHATGQSADAELISRVEADIRALGFPQAFDPKLRVGFAGDVAARVEEARGLESDLTLSGLLVLLLVGGSVAAFYRSFRALPILGLPLSLGAFGAFGLAALPPLSITYLNSNTAFLGSIVIGNGINSGIILLSRYAEERRNGAATEFAVERAVSETWKATLAASLAASAAYGSLIFTDFRGFNQFGWIGGIGLLTCWVANYTLLPVLAATLGGPLGARPEQRSDSSTPSLLGRLVLVHPRWVLWTLGAFCLVSAAALAQRSSDFIEYDLSKLRRRDSWDNGERYWGKRLDSALGRYLTPTLILAESSSEAERIRARVRELQQKDAAGALIGNVRSAADLLPSDREQTLAEMRQLEQILTPRLLAELNPEQRRLVQRALSPDAQLPLEAGQLPASLLLGLRERSGRIDRTVLVFPKLGSGTWDAERLDAFASDLRQAAVLEGGARPVAGSLLLSSDIARAMRADGPRATLLSLGAVLLICLFAFRRPASEGSQQGRLFDPQSLHFSATAVASLLAGVLLMLGILSLTGQRLNFSNFVALPITFGVAADYAINVLKRYQSETTGSLGRALTSTGGAVALCSATTVIGFGSLLLAQNQALFSFGVFAVTGELACLATAVIAVPAALALWQSRHSEPPRGTARRAGSELGAATAIHR